MIKNIQKTDRAFTLTEVVVALFLMTIIWLATINMIVISRASASLAKHKAQALEGEAHGVDEVDAGADEGITEFEAKQIMLGLGGAMLDGMEQGRINPRQPGEHLGVAPVALAFVAGDGVELARVGDEHGGTAPREEPADPRAVGASFQRNGGVRELCHQLRQCRSGVG